MFVQLGILNLVHETEITLLGTGIGVETLEKKPHEPKILGIVPKKLRHLLLRFNCDATNG